ncbi:DUF1146 family protein [Phocicoccus pinnipedialis]|nr:DUF1146 family protein [Jeotgalicoccus pinnipedialis]
MHIILHIVCTIFAFYLLDCLNIEVLFKKSKPEKIRLVIILLAILLGTSLSNFIMDLFTEIQVVALLFG